MAKKKNKQKAPLEAVDVVEAAAAAAETAEAPAASMPADEPATEVLGDLKLPVPDLPIAMPEPEAEAEPEAVVEPVTATEPAAVSEPAAETAKIDAPIEAEVYETSEEIFREAGRAGPIRAAAQHPLTTLRTGGILLLICAMVALAVSFVNAITADTIAETAAREQQAAIVRIFGEGESIDEIEPLDGMKAVYAVGEAGYCVSLDARGFGGKIDMMVGVGRDGVLRGVEIVSHKETPGYGDRAAEPEYLAQYVGQGAALTLGVGIDAVSGATISSRGVIAGVNAATAALIEAGLIEIYHAPPPEPELTEEERLQAELDALMEELGISAEEYEEYGEGYDG